MKEVVEIEEKQRYYPFEIIYAIFGLLGCETTTSDTQKIHTTLAALRNQHEILEPIVFSHGGLWPYSDLLQRTIGWLHLGRLIYTTNIPDMDTYRIAPSLKTFVRENILPKFACEELLELREVARLFEAKCGKEV